MAEAKMAEANPEGKTPEGCKAQGRKRVLVVGAGISGIVAARTLVRHGGFDVLVLEGRQNRYGGRIWSETDVFTDDAVVDLGASWIHGSNPHHPITMLRDKFDIETVPTDYKYHAKVWDHHSKSPLGKTKLLYHAAKFFYNQRKLKHVGQRSEEDLSIQKATESSGQQDSSSCPVWQLLRLATWEGPIGASYDKISVKLMEAGVDFSGSEELFPMGYAQLLKRLVDGDEKRRPLKIIFNAVVSRVTYSDDDDSVLVITDDGSEYASDCVVVTVPLGVLKAGDIEFDPPLPPERERIIKRVGFGTYNKLVLEFDKVFWCDTAQFYAVTPASDSPKDLMLSYWLNMHSISGKPILVGFMAGESALVSESMSDNDLKEIGLSRLKVMFGEATVDGSKVVSMIRTKWNDDPFSRGSYSFPSVGQHMCDWEELGKPLGKLIHFAGEHTHPQFWSTVHGAYLSGRRAANDVIGNYYPQDKHAEPTIDQKHHGDYRCAVS